MGEREQIIIDAERTEARVFYDSWQAAPAAVVEALGLSASQQGDTIVLRSTALGHWLFNRVIGLGLTEPATRQQVDSILDEFVAAGTSHGVSVVDIARPAELPAWLLARGLKQTTTLARMLRSTDALPAPRVDADIRLVGADDGARFGRTLVAGFGLPPAGADWFASLCGRDGWRTYLAYDGDQPIATGVLYVYGQTGWLGFGSTLPNQRGRGLQQAMLCRRMADAAELGCQLLQTETNLAVADEPTPSLNNIKRVGFEMAYTRPNYVAS